MRRVTKVEKCVMTSRGLIWKMRRLKIQLVTEQGGEMRGGAGR